MSKKPIQKLLSYILTINYMFDVTQSEIWKDCEVTADQHDNTLGWVEEKVSILYK